MNEKYINMLLLGWSVGTCCAILSSLSMWSSVVLPALSNPRNTSLPDFLYRPKETDPKRTCMCYQVSCISKTTLSKYSWWIFNVFIIYAIPEKQKMIIETNILGFDIERYSNQLHYDTIRCKRHSGSTEDFVFQNFSCI